MKQTKPFWITKRQVWEAYKRVKANQGAAGVDGQTIQEFEENLEDNLYKLWNRLASGSYFPPPVPGWKYLPGRRTDAAFGHPNGVRPNRSNEAVKEHLEPDLKKHFHADS